MLQPLLADRFKLKVHKETKLLSIYELVIAKNGPKLKEAKPGDTDTSGTRGANRFSRPGTILDVYKRQRSCTSGGEKSNANLLSQLAKVISHRW